MQLSQFSKGRLSVWYPSPGEEICSAIAAITCDLQRCPEFVIWYRHLSADLLPMAAQTHNYLKRSEKEPGPMIFSMPRLNLVWIRLVLRSFSKALRKKGLDMFEFSHQDARWFSPSQVGGGPHELLLILDSILHLPLPVASRSWQRSKAYSRCGAVWRDDTLIRIGQVKLIVESVPAWKTVILLKEMVCGYKVFEVYQMLHLHIWLVLVCLPTRALLPHTSGQGGETSRSLESCQANRYTWKSWSKMSQKGCV